MKVLVCCFIGHRKIEITEELEQKIKEIIEDLIVNHNVLTFLFGSRSNFDCLCLKVVTHLKEKYPDIKRIAYTCRSEACILESEREKWEKIYSDIYKQEMHFFGVEEEFEHKTKYTSGKGAYVERNMAMIDDSDYCLFYYDEHYFPPQRKYSKHSDRYYTPKSGTSIAYKYARQKKKQIFNLFI